MEIKDIEKLKKVNCLEVIALLETEVGGLKELRKQTNMDIIVGDEGFLDEYIY